MKLSLLILFDKTEPNILDPIIAREKAAQIVKFCTPVSVKPLRTFFIIIGVAEYHAKELSNRTKTTTKSF